MAAVREKARQHGNPEGLFDTFHIRRGDLQYDEAFIEAGQIIDNVGDLLEEGGTIFIATDEKNMTYFDPLREHYHLYFLNDFMDEVGTINKNFYGMLDQRIASRGRNFFGVSYPISVATYLLKGCVHATKPHANNRLLSSLINFVLARHTIPHSPVSSLGCVGTMLS